MLPEERIESGIWSELETLSAVEALRLDVQRLPAQLSYVFANSPFYKAKLGGLDPDLDYSLMDNFQRLPFTEKAEVLLDIGDKPPFGRNLTVSDDKLRRVHKTSGTTGQPMCIAMTEEDIKNTAECGAACFWAAGLRPGDMVIHCLNYCLWAGGYTDHYSLEHTGATVIPYGVGNTKQLIKTILHFKPTVIHCTPSYLSRLEVVLDEDFGLKPGDLGFKLAVMGGEPGLQNIEFKKRIEESWGMKARNANYGMADVLSMFGAECEYQCGLHFMGRGVVLPELIDSDTGQVLDIEEGVQGELVLTNLRRQAQPLLRFRTRDMVEIKGVNMCQCGRSTFRFDVVGRSDDKLDIKGINVFPQSIAKVISSHLSRLSGEHQILINKEDPVDRMIVKAEMKAGEHSDDNLKDVLAVALSEEIVVRPEVELVEYGDLPRTEGKTVRVMRTL